MIQNSILDIRALSQSYYVRSILGKNKERPILKDIHLTIFKGETYGLVGESGSGKSTLAKVILGLVPAKSGEIKWKGEHLTLGTTKGREGIQVVFQQPMDSLNPRMCAQKIIQEPLDIHTKLSLSQKQDLVSEAMQSVGLNTGDLQKLPAAFSGGQAQRIAIARSIILKPDLLILDEAVSALDVSIQAQILNLLLQLQREKGMAYLFISHDLRVIRHISDRIGVMRNGEIVEEAETDLLFSSPKHAYTKELIRSIPGIQ